MPQSDDVSSGWPETPPGADPLPGQLDRWLSARGAELVAVRRHLHAHPELSGREFETAKLVFRQLTAAGLSPRLLPNRNGVICDVPGNGTTSSIIALRADLDALPLQDAKDVPYRSTVEGVCHACGHDIHTTVLLGAGLALAKLARRGELPGTVRLLFQPAEENAAERRARSDRGRRAEGRLGDLRSALRPADAGRPRRRTVRTRSPRPRTSSRSGSRARVATPPGRISPPTSCTRSAESSWTSRRFSIGGSMPAAACRWCSARSGPARPPTRSRARDSPGRPCGCSIARPGARCPTW